MADRQRLGFKSFLTSLVLRAISNKLSLENRKNPLPSGIRLRGYPQKKTLSEPIGKPIFGLKGGLLPGARYFFTEPNFVENWALGKL